MRDDATENDDCIGSVRYTRYWRCTIRIRIVNNNLMPAGRALRYLVMCGKYLSIPFAGPKIIRTGHHPRHTANLATSSIRGERKIFSPSVVICKDWQHSERLIGMVRLQVLWKNAAAC